jgi:hypothetical protein
VVGQDNLENLLPPKPLKIIKQKTKVSWRIQKRKMMGKIKLDRSVLLDKSYSLSFQISYLLTKIQTKT